MVVLASISAHVIFLFRSEVTASIHYNVSRLHLDAAGQAVRTKRRSRARRFRVGGACRRVALAIPLSTELPDLKPWLRHLAGTPGFAAMQPRLGWPAIFFAGRPFLLTLG